MKYSTLVRLCPFYTLVFFVDNLYSVLSTQGTKTVGNRNYILFAIPFTLLINITLSKLIGEPVIDVWDILSVFILLIVSVAFIIGDYARKKVL